MAEGSPAAWRVDRYAPGDETAILELFNVVFGKPRSAAHWAWEFRDNPYGGPFISLARRVSDGKLIGSYSVMPMQLNVAGRAVAACQSVDTAVHPDHRGQRVFEKLATDCYAWCQSEGLAAVFGFPNANSYPGFLRNLEWKRIAFLTQHIRRLSVAPMLKSVLRVPGLPALGDLAYRAPLSLKLAATRADLRRRGPADVTFNVATTVPPSYEPMWAAARSHEVLSIWKDASYFAWRYDKNPDHQFEYLSLSRGDEMLALAVGSRSHGRLELCEIVVRQRDVPTGRRLLNEICGYALTQRLNAVSFVAHDVGFYDDIATGFARQTSYANVFCGRAFNGAVGDLLPLAHNWTVTFGDTDFI